MLLVRRSMAKVIVSEDAMDIAGLSILCGPCLFYAPYREEQRDEIH
jgi:hypothetical protein